MLDLIASLSLLEVLAVTAYGMFLILLCAGALFLIYKVARAAIAAGSRRDAAESPAPPQEDEDEIHAVLISAVSEAVHLPVDKFRIVSIRQIG